MSALKYRADIDGLRALAVLSVVLFHMTGATGGFVGVDIFFVISGYLITTIIFREIDEGRFTIAGFYERRIRRIIPALAVVVFTTLAVFAFFYTPVDYKALGQSAGATFAFVSNIFFLLKNDYFDPSSESAPLLHTWSLAVEEQYYLFFPVFAVFVARLSSARRVLALAVAFLLSLGLCLWLVRIDASLAFYMPFTRFWELLAGAILAIAGLNAPATRLGADAVGFGGLLLLAACIVLFTPGMLFPAESAVLPCVGAAALIHAGRNRQSAICRVMGWKPLVFIGKISYSLYLWHWPVIVAARYILFRDMNPGEQLVALAVMFLLAWLSWRFVEQPLRASGLTTRRQLFAGMAALAGAVFAFAALAHVTGGFPQRFSDPAGSYASAVGDINPRRRACDRPSEARIESDDVCAIGAEKTTASFVMIGDSFTDALMPGMAEYAARRGLKGYVLPHSGCFPLAGVRQQNPECGVAAEAALAFVDRHPEIGTVVLAARWTSAYFGNRFGQVHGGDWFITDDQSTGESYAENKQVFRRGLERLVERLAGRRIVVLAHLPEQAYDIPRALALNAAYGVPASVALPRALHEARQGEVRSVLAEIARGDRFSIVDIGAPLCASGQCIVQNGRDVLYVDDNHPGRTGAIFMMESLGEGWLR